MSRERAEGRPAAVSRGGSRPNGRSARGFPAPRRGVARSGSDRGAPASSPERLGRLPSGVPGLRPRPPLIPRPPSLSPALPASGPRPGPRDALAWAPSGPQSRGSARPGAGPRTAGPRLCGTRRLQRPPPSRAGGRAPRAGAAGLGRARCCPRAVATDSSTVSSPLNALK